LTELLFPSAAVESDLVRLLSACGRLLLRLTGPHKPQQTTITNEKIKILIGRRLIAVVFHASEGNLVSNVSKLDEQRSGAIMRDPDKFKMSIVNKAG
jgi:putative hemolysin